jgi:hypothetical protein
VIHSQFLNHEQMPMNPDPITARNLQLVQELRQVIHTLESDGIQAVPFGAAVFAMSAYEHIGLRPFHMLEIVVEEKHILRAKDLMVRNGYDEEYTLTRGQQVALVHCRGSYSLERTDHLAHLRISGQNDSENLPPRFNIENLNLAPLSVDGEMILAPSPEDLLLTRCAYFAQSYFSPRIDCLSEIARFIGRYPSLDWQRVARRADDLGIKRQLAIVLILVSDLCDSLPESVMTSVQADPLVLYISEEIRTQLVYGDSTPGFFARCAVSLNLLDRIRDKFRFLVHLLLTPSWEDCVLAPLPERLWFLCYVLRPVRLLGKYLGLLRPKKLTGFIPTHMEVVDKMLSLAEIKPDDMIYDLGCGDGRILIEAAKRFGARGIGVDLEPERIAEARKPTKTALASHPGGIFKIYLWQIGAKS